MFINNMMRIAVLSFIVTVGLVSANLRHESTFDPSNLVDHTFYMDTLMNTISEKPKKWFDKRKDLIASTHEYHMYHESADSLEHAIPLVAEHLGLEEYEHIPAFLEIFSEDTEDLESWHSLVFIDHSIQQSKVAFFRYDRADSEVYIHLVTGDVDSDMESGKYIVHFISHYGQRAEKSGKIFIINHGEEEHSSILTQEAKECLHKSFVKMMHKAGFESRGFLKNIGHVHFHSKKLQFLPLIGAAIQAKGTEFAIQMVVKVAQKIIQFFGKRVESKHIKTIQRNGFSYYNAHARIIQNRVIGKYLNGYMDYIVKLLTKNHPKHKAEIEANLMSMTFLPDLAWAIADPNFDTASQSSDKYFGIMYNNENGGQTYNVVILNSEVEFQLAPDILVYKVTTKQMGNTNEEAKLEYAPRDVTAEEIQGIRLFNLMLVTKRLHDDATGRSSDFPSIPQA